MTKLMEYQPAGLLWVKGVSDGLKVEVKKLGDAFLVMEGFASSFGEKSSMISTVTVLDLTVSAKWVIEVCHFLGFPPTT